MHKAAPARRKRPGRPQLAGHARPVRGTAAGREIIGALTDLLESLETGRPHETQFTVRTVEVTEPGAYDAAGVLATRERVGASQAVFAKMLGVSRVLAQSWEQGTRTPSASARRLMDLMNADPVRWGALIRPKVPGRNGNHK